MRKYLIEKHSAGKTNDADLKWTEAVQHFPMVYSYQTRILLFKLAGFNSMRNKYYSSELSSRIYAHEYEGVSIPKRRLILERNLNLRTAFRITKTLQSDYNFIEFQFQNEAGTGLGPTLECYALLSRLIKEQPKMWRATSDNSLFPRPINPAKVSEAELNEIESFFEFVGTLVARSLMDERLVDLPISKVFWKLAFAKKIKIHDLKNIDMPLYKGLMLLQNKIDLEEYKSDRSSASEYLRQKCSEYAEDVQDGDAKLVKQTDTQQSESQNTLNVEDLCL